MKNKEKKTINLDILRSKLHTIKHKPDTKLQFEFHHSLFLVLNLININISLYSTSYYNYNYSLLIFNSLFLSRKLFQTLYSYCTIRSPNTLTLSTLLLYLILGIYSILLLHSLISLFFNHSFNIILNMICPFTAYEFLAYSAMTSRYSDGSIDCFYSLQKISLNSLEILYCAGYLPYKFFPTSGFYLNLPVFLNALLVVFLCDIAMHFGEFIKRRGAELVFFAHTQGDWQRTGEIATEEWQPEKGYSKGMIVKHKGDCWKGMGKMNNCEPGKFEAYVLTFIFKDPVKTLKTINFVTAGSAVIHNIYMVYLPFQYSQVISIMIFSYVLVQNMTICKKLKLPNV